MSDDVPGTTPVTTPFAGELPRPRQAPDWLMFGFLMLFLALAMLVTALILVAYSNR
jgi:hypothetical protein